MQRVRSISTVLALLLTATTASAQLCPADLDRSGAATVDELLVAVDGALGQCRADPGCPFGYVENTQGMGDCSFRGSAGDSPNCDRDDILGAFYSDGDTLVFFFPGFQPPLYFGARPIDPEVAMVFGYTHDLNVPTIAIEGLLLMNEQHSSLTLSLESSPFTVTGCKMNRFTATYEGLFHSGGGSAAEQALDAFRAQRAARPDPEPIELDSAH